MLYRGVQTLLVLLGLFILQVTQEINYRHQLMLLLLLDGHHIQVVMVVLSVVEVEVDITSLVVMEEMVL